MATAYPLLLVPGWKDRGRVLQRLRNRFLRAGWPANAVRIVDFDDPFGSNRSHAEEIAVAADALRGATRSAAVDVVAHSMGGLALRRYLASYGCDGVRRAVFVATPHRGTWAALLAWGGGRGEMVPGSPFLTELGASVPASVRAVTVRTIFDFRIFPGSSARLSGAADVLVPLATHRGLIQWRAGFAAIHEALTAP